MSGRRAAFKVAVKNARRNRKRSLFLVLLVAVPVAIGVVAGGMVRANSHTPEERAQLRFGAADALVQGYANAGEVGIWIREVATTIDPDVEILDFAREGTFLEDYTFALVTDIDITHPLTEGMYVLIDGRTPSSSGEAAISPSLAETLELEIGDTTDLEELGLQGLEIVGLVSPPLVEDSSTLLLAPGAFDLTLARGGDTTFLIGGDRAEEVAYGLEERWWSEGQQLFWPEPAIDPKPPELEFLEDELYVHLTEAEILELVDMSEEAEFFEVHELANEMVYRSGTGPHELAFIWTSTRSQELSQRNFEESPGLLSTGASALLLIEVAFVTGAAFAAGTRRRLREIGLLGANGASEKHVRTTVIGEGLSIGLVASALGVLLGITVLIVARPLLQQFASRLITGLGVGITDVAGPVVVALVSVLLAVWIPARTAGKVPVTTALQGRMPASSPRKWVVPVGLGAAGGGLLLITVALASTSNFAAALVGVGGVLVVGGVAMMASPILAGISHASDHVPAASRLVLRDSGRHRTRASVAVAAIMVILLAPVTMATTAAMSTHQDLVYGLPEPDDQILLSGSFDPRFGDSAGLDEDEIATAASALPERAIGVFETLGLRTLTKEQIDMEDADRHNTLVFGELENMTAAASDSLVRALGDARVAEAVAAGRIVVLGVEDKETLVSLNEERYPAVEIAVPVVRWEMPRVLLPESVAERYPDAERRPLALFILERPLTSSEHNELNAQRLAVSGGRGGLNQAEVMAIGLAVAFVVVLIVIALITAVSAAEVDEELRTIVAVGAPGSFRRRFLGLMTGYQTLIAAALAVPLGLALVKVGTLATETYYQGPFGEVPNTEVIVPWGPLAVVGLALPVVVGLLTWMSVRSAPVTPPRRAT